MIVDSHMHVGEFPLFNVAMDRDELVEEMRQNDISTGLVFHPDNEFVAGIVTETKGVYGLVWANPRNPQVVAETTALLDTPGVRAELQPCRAPSFAA